MPLPRHIQEELELKRAAEHRLAQRDAFWANVRTALACVAWAVLGLLVMAWGLRTTDPDFGKIAWLGGQVVGYAGILVTIVRWYARARECGDAQ